MKMSTITKLKMKIEIIKMEIEYLEWMLDTEELDFDTIQYIFINLKKPDIDKTIEDKKTKINNRFEEIEINETANEDDQFDDNSSDASSDVSDEDLSDKGKKKRLNELRDDINETERKIHNVCSSESPDIAEILMTRMIRSLKRYIKLHEDVIGPIKNSVILVA